MNEGHGFSRAASRLVLEGFSPLYDIVGVVKVFFVCFWGKQLLRWWERGQGRRFLAFILTLDPVPTTARMEMGTKLRRFSELRSITGKTVLHC